MTEPRPPLASRIGRRLAGWWFAALPAERLAGLRILIGLYAAYYVYGRAGYLAATNRLPASNFHPIGVVDWVLDAPLPPTAWSAIIVATQITAVAFACGIAYRVTAPVFAALLLFAMTYRNSWAMVFHTENLMVLHVLALALAPAADAWSVDRWWRARRGAPPAAPDGRYAWAVRLAACLTVITYVIAGLAKLRLTGIDWLDGDQLRNQIAYDNLRKALLGDVYSELAVPLLEHPGFFVGLSIATVVIEAGAPVALLGGRIAAAWALCAWAFHVGVVLLMAIYFPYQLTGVAYAPLLRVERPLGFIARTVGGRFRRRPAT